MKELRCKQAGQQHIRGVSDWMLLLAGSKTVES